MPCPGFVPRLIRVAAVLVAVPAMLAGCTSMPLTSMVKLARTDFTTVDPAALRVAVKVPQGIRPRPHGVRLVLTTVVEGQKDVREFVLDDVADLAELASLRGEVSKGTAVHAFRLAAADVTRLVAARASVLERKQRGASGSITLGVAADGCRTGPLPDRIPLTTYLRTESDGAFFPLARDIDLRAAVPADALMDTIPPCG